MKTTKTLLNICAVSCFIYGALYFFSLIFIPVAMYCFAIGKKFSYKADNITQNYFDDKRAFKAYTIFVSIACFPIGLLSIICYLNLFGNNVRVETKQAPETQNSEDVNMQETKEDKEDNQDSENLSKSRDAEVEQNEQVQEPVRETEEEKLEKLAKLKNFKEKGIITEEEFEMAKEQMFGKKE